LDGCSEGSVSVCFQVFSTSREQADVLLDALNPG